MNDTGINVKASICFDDFKKEEDLIFVCTTSFLFIGNFHIHKEWMDSKPSSEHYLQELIQYDSTIKD